MSILWVLLLFNEASKLKSVHYKTLTKKYSLGFDFPQVDSIYLKFGISKSERNKIADKIEAEIFNSMSN